MQVKNQQRIGLVKFWGQTDPSVPINAKMPNNGSLQHPQEGSNLPNHNPQSSIATLNNYGPTL